MMTEEEIDRQADRLHKHIAAGLNEAMDKGFKMYATQGTATDDATIGVTAIGHLLIDVIIMCKGCAATDEQVRTVVERGLAIWREGGKR